METAISIIGICFSGITLVILLINFFTTRKRDTQKETADDVRESSMLREGVFKANLKLDQVCTVTNDIKLDVKEINQRMFNYGERISVLEHICGIQKEDKK